MVLIYTPDTRSWLFSMLSLSVEFKIQEKWPHLICGEIQLCFLSFAPFQGRMDIRKLIKIGLITGRNFSIFWAILQLHRKKQTMRGLGPTSRPPILHPSSHDPQWLCRCYGQVLGINHPVLLPIDFLWLALGCPVGMSSFVLSVYFTSLLQAG